MGYIFSYTNYGQIAYFVFQTFNKLTLDTFLKLFFIFYMYSLSAMKSRRNGTEVEFECRRNGSRRNGSRRNGENNRRNGSRRNGSRRNGSDSMPTGVGKFCFSYMLTAGNGCKLVQVCIGQSLSILTFITDSYLLILT